MSASSPSWSQMKIARLREASFCGLNTGRTRYAMLSCLAETSSLQPHTQNMPALVSGQ
jgi:hypothetical protein